MPISEGWCVEAVCDRCKKTIYTPYRANVRSTDVIANMGWGVEAREVLCPYCKMLRDIKKQTEAQRRKKPRRQRRP